MFDRARRAAVVVALATLIGGCTKLFIVQNPDDVLIRVGDAAEFRRAADYASSLVPYALLAGRAYDDLRAGATEPEPALTAAALRSPEAAAWLARWRRVHWDFGPLACPAADPDCRKLGGLAVQIWTRRGRVCGEAVIAFRGTDADSADDWLTNLRWVTRALPLYDQYDQVRAHVGRLVGFVASLPCYREGVTRITAVGHSLGGGLAQQAAYADPRIRRVVAFDSSAVTGYYAVEPAARRHNERGLEIERVYEHGEVLAYLRLVMRVIYPLSACDPQIRTLRFEALKGSVVSQHSMDRVVEKLLSWAPAPPADGRTPAMPARTPIGCAPGPS